MIAGNKCDMPNFAVSRELGENFAREVGSEHVFTSAKTGKGVEEVFRTLVTSKSLHSDPFRNGGQRWCKWTVKNAKARGPHGPEDRWGVRLRPVNESEAYAQGGRRGCGCAAREKEEGRLLFVS